MLKAKVRPIVAEEEDVGILMALPTQKVAESFHAAGPDEDIKRRVLSRVHVLIKRLSCDHLRVWQQCRTIRRRGARAIS